MQKIREEAIKDIFKRINSFLKLDLDGKYIFKNNKFRDSITDYYGNKELIPKDKQISEKFEEIIISKIPYAILFIYHGSKLDKIMRATYLRVEVDIDPKNKEFFQIQKIERQLDLFESYRALFFPTTKEVKAKIGDSPLKLTYLSERFIDDYEIKGSSLIYTKDNVKTQRGTENLEFELLSEIIEDYIENKKFKNPIPTNKRTLPKNSVAYQQELQYVKQFFEEFLDCYQKMIEDNFNLTKNFFYLYTKLPVRINVYVEKALDYFFSETAKIDCVFEEVPKKYQNQVRIIKTKVYYDENKHLFTYGTYTSYLLYENINTLDFTYIFIERELKEILEKITKGIIFEDIQPIQLNSLKFMQDRYSEARASLLEYHAKSILSKEYGYEFFEEDKSNLLCELGQIDLLFNNNCIKNKNSKSIELDLIGVREDNEQKIFILGECKSGKNKMTEKELKCYIIKTNMFAHHLIKNNKHESKQILFHLIIISLEGLSREEKMEEFIKKFWNLPTKHIYNSKIELIVSKEFKKLLKKHKIFRKGY